MVHRRRDGIMAMTAYSNEIIILESSLLRGPDFSSEKPLGEFCLFIR